MAMLQGVARWAKVIGDPQLNYSKDGKEWSIDVELNDEAIEQLKSLGCAPNYIKVKEDRDPYIKFVRRSVNKDGTEAKPIAIVDNKGQLWDGKTLIGNGSIVNVKFNMNDVKQGPNKGFKKPSLIAMQVWKLETYDNSFPIAEDDEDVATEEVWTEE